MAASATLVHMAHERKVENLRAFMVNLANSRGLSLPETKLFEQKFLDLCLSRTPDHPTYSAMIFIAITELNEEGGSCKEAISEFIKSKYKNLPFAHTSLLSHHLAKLVVKREILCDNNSNNYCYTLPGENKKTVSSADAERKSNVIKVRRNGQHAVSEVMTRPIEEESDRILTFGDNKVGLSEERSLTESETSSKRKACGDINLVEEGSHKEDNGVRSCLRDSTVEETLRTEGVAEEPEAALGNSETEGMIEADSEGVELYEVDVLDAQNGVLMEDSGKEEEHQVEIISEQRKVKLRRKSNTMKEACVEVKSEAYKRLWECQTEACGNIISLEKMLKQCREKDQQNKAVSEIDDVSRLPLSMESCKELWKFVHKIQSQLSEMIDSFDETGVPCHESRGCEIKAISNVTKATSTQLEQKEKENDPKMKQQVKKTRVKRLRDIETSVLRKSPRMHKAV